MTHPVDSSPINPRPSAHTRVLAEFLAGEIANRGLYSPRAAGDALLSALPDDTFWRRVDEFAVTHFTEEGDLIFEIDDLFTPSGFWNGTIIRQWADRQSFDIDDLDPRDVLWHLLEESLFPAMRELLPNAAELLAAVEGTKHGELVPELPEFRIIVNGREAVMRTIAHFDGPFASDADAVSAVERRCGAISAPDPGAAMLEF